MTHASEELPVIVARFADEAVGEYLARVAQAGSAVYVPLIAAPASKTLHLLEVYVPGRSEPMTFLAEVLGPAGEKGYPLRLGAAPPRRPKATMAYASTLPVPRGSAATQYADGGPPPVSADRVMISGAAEVAKDPLIGRSLAGGKLRIEASVGQGGAGTVYRAQHRDLQMSVAVKVMHEGFQRDADFCKRFHAEALSASRLDHPNLTRVLDFGQEPDGLLYIAMEFLDGKSLRDVLIEERTLPFERVAQIMIQVCSGLTHAHARSIVHRDIKPENLVLVRGLDEDGRETDTVKVCDFGIAHRSASDSPAVFAGTAEYISPEQFRGEDPDVQSDVYACGVVLYELLTGTVPIPGDMPEIIDRVIRLTPEPPSRRVAALDARIDRLVLKALSKDREIRHASVRELRTELKETAEEISIFSAGGYWNDATGSVSNAPTSSGRPQVAASDGSPDWLERGTGYLASLTPPARSASSTPASVRVPQASAVGPRPSDSAPQRGSGSAHPQSGNLSLGPPPLRRPSLVDLPRIDARSAGSSIMPGSHVSMTPPVSSEAEDVARSVATFLKHLVATTDPDRFAVMVSAMAPKIRALVEQGHVGPAWSLCSALGMIATEPPGVMSRAAPARGALAVFSEPVLLATVAEIALDALRDRDGLARKLLRRAGNLGAHAAYSARTKHSVFEARERFVALLQEIGADALPTLRKALERLESRLSVPGALWIAEDLLKSVPDVRDEELGQCVARYAKRDVASLALLATLALPRSWGPRARSILIAQLHHKDDDVAVAAMKCLRRLGIDVEIVSQLRNMILGTTRSRLSLRLAAVEALLDATQDALPLARTTLAETLATTEGITSDVEDMVVTTSSVLLAIKGDGTLVAERWRKSTGFLRTRLETLLRQARA